jgi:hypothetical protein
MSPAGCGTAFTGGEWRLADRALSTFEQRGHNGADLRDQAGKG